MNITSIIIDDEWHALTELADLITKIPGIILTGRFEDVTSALTLVRECGRVNVIFCDISMPELNGIQAGKLLRQHCDFLIYVTAYREYALDAFNIHADGYILKPVSMEAIMDKIAWIAQQRKKRSIRKEQRGQGAVFVKGSQKNSFIKIELEEIRYAKAMLNYVEIFTQRQKHTTYMGLKTLEKELIKYPNFRRISKSFIINIDYIKNIDGNMVVLEGESSLAIGETYKSAFHAFMRKRTLNP